MYILPSFHFVSNCLQRKLFRQEDLNLIQRDNLWFECQLILHSNFSLFQFNQNFKAPKRPFKRLEYKDAITYLKEHDIKKDDGTFYEFGEVMYMFMYYKYWKTQWNRFFTLFYIATKFLGECYIYTESVYNLKYMYLYFCV